MPATVEFHPEALNELLAAQEWYAERAEGLGDAFAAELERAVDLISEQPLAWPLFEGEIRKFVVRRFPFSVFYRSMESAIQILAVAHAKRKPGYWKGR
jgi:plasmid stabilization system protein ParE